MSTAFASYDATRNFSNKAVRALCYAPHTNLFFDRLGSARVCCWNWSQPAGNVTTHSLDEIWASAQAAMLRDEMNAYRFAEGCGFCKFQAAEGWFGGAKMRNFDRFTVESESPHWPKQMEFSISNACNLECVMCDGEHSSAIRAQRERRPAMARLYTDEILEAFRKYLPHLQQAKFLGGEPFLAVEHYKLWEMMIEDGLQTPCHATTNGTQYNARIEHMLERLPFGFAISLDGATKNTIERVRLNTDYDELMRNVARFRAYAKARKTPFSLTYCLMRPNWEEFGAFCLMADAWDCPVGVNTVLHPAGLSIYTLPPEEMRKILETMERQAAGLQSQLSRNKAVWFDEFERIRRKCVAEPAAPPPVHKAKSENTFVLTVHGDAEIDQASPALHFLKKFSKAGIIVAQGEAQRHTAHDQLLDLDVPATVPPGAAKNFIKTQALAKLVGKYTEFIFLDASAITLRNSIDDIFLTPATPVSFASTGLGIDAASRSLVNCRCQEPRCHHAREAILCAFGIDIPSCDWEVFDERLFRCNAQAGEFVTAWHEATMRLALDPYWVAPERAALAAMAWKYGLATNAPLPEGFVRLMPPPETQSGRNALRPAA